MVCSIAVAEVESVAVSIFVLLGLDARYRLTAGGFLGTLAPLQRQVRLAVQKKAPNGRNRRRLDR